MRVESQGFGKLKLRVNGKEYKKSIPQSIGLTYYHGLSNMAPFQSYTPSRQTYTLMMYHMRNTRTVQVKAINAKQMVYE